VAFSGDKTFAAVCRRPGGAIYFDKVGRDKLVLIDLSQKTIIYQQPFTCLNMPMVVLTKDGSKLIAADAYIGKYGFTWHKLLIMNTTPPIEKKIFDIGCDGLNALTLSPDESMLVIACNDGTLRFLDPNTASEIYRLANVDPSIWGLAFSKDGKMLAMASKRGYISVWEVQTVK
jgi:WD40 repeat protein